MKKSTINTLLIVGAAAAAFFIFTSMRRRSRSTVEAGPTEKITAEEFEAAEVVESTPMTKPAAPAILDIVKSLKRSPQKKAAAKARKVLKKQPKAKKAVQTFLTMPRAVRGFDDISVLY